MPKKEQTTVDPEQLSSNPLELAEVVTDYYPEFLDKEDKQKTDEQKAAEYVDQRWKSMLAARSDYETIWEENEKNYRVEAASVDESDEVENWRSTHTTALTHGMIETAVAEFADTEPDSDVASQKDSYEDNVKTVKKIIEHTKYKGDYDFQKQLALRSIGIYGTAIWHEYYREDVRYIKTLKNYDEKSGKKTYEISKGTEYNDCFGEVVSPWDFGVDENAVTMSEASDCGYREVLSMTDFKRIYGDMPYVEEAKPGGELEQKEPYPRPEGNNDEERIEVIHYYNKPYDIHWIVANGTLINDFEDSLPDDHKELPFAEGCFIKMPGHFWGLSMAQILSGTQAELDTIRRLRIDRAKLNIAKVFLVSAREDLSDDDLGIVPGKRIPVSDPQKAIVPVDFQDTGLSGYKEEESLIEDARWSTGISNPSMAASNNSSATEASIVKEATLKRLRASLSGMRITFFQRIGRLRTANILQHYQDPIKVNQVTGKNGEEKWEAVYRQIDTQDEKGQFSTITVSPEDIRGQFTYYTYPTNNIPLSQELEKQKKERLFDKIMGVPVVDPEKAIRWLFNGLGEDADKVLMEGIGVPNEELADSENARMMQGAQLPPTLNATPDHTNRHYKFVTENAYQIDENLDKIFSSHINGEMNPVSPAGVGGIVPPTGADGQVIGQPPMPGGPTGPDGGGQMAMGGGNPMVGLPGSGMPAAPNGAPAIAPDMSMDQQLMQ